MRPACARNSLTKCDWSAKPHSRAKVSPANTGGVVDVGQRPTEAQQPLIGLGGQAHVGTEDLLQPSARQPQVFAELGDARLFGRGRDASRGIGGGRMGLHRESNEAFAEDLLDGLNLAPRARNGEDAFAEFGSARAPHFGERHL